MKMIARMFCAAALVLGALSLAGCGGKEEPKKDAPKSTSNNTQQVQGSNTTTQTQQ